MLRAYDRLLDGLAVVAVLLIFAIMVGVGADVALRYLFNRPIVWMLEFTEHSLVAILFLGMAWLVRERGHVAIDLVVNAVPRSVATAMRVASSAIAGATAGFLAYWAVVATIDDYRRGVETWGLYPIPRSLLSAVAALGLLLTAVEFLRGTVSLIKPDGSAGEFERRGGVADQFDRIA